MEQPEPSCRLMTRPPAPAPRSQLAPLAAQIAVREAVKSKSPYLMRLGERGRQCVLLRDQGQSGEERSVEHCDLCHIDEGFAAGADPAQRAGIVQGRELTQRLDLCLDARIDATGTSQCPTAVHDPMHNGFERLQLGPRSEALEGG